MFATVAVLKQLRRESSAIEAHVFFYRPYPGTELVGELTGRGVRLPDRLEDWDDFNNNAHNAGLSSSRPRIERRVRNINFYVGHGYSTSSASSARRLLQAISRFRCSRDWYGFPLERYVVEALRRRKVVPA